VIASKLNLNICLLKTNHREGNILVMTARTFECPYTFVYLFELLQLPSWYSFPELVSSVHAYMLSLMMTFVSQVVFQVLSIEDSVLYNLSPAKSKPVVIYLCGFSRLVSEYCRLRFQSQSPNQISKPAGITNTRPNRIFSNCTMST
jgi:hypothetical protein